jgi:hypothetical protein
MIKHMKKIPSFHHLQEHVSLFLTVIQLSIIFFVFIPPINAGTKLMPISEPNDWTGIIDALSKAKMTGQSIWISLLPVPILFSIRHKHELILQQFSILISFFLPILTFPRSEFKARLA